MKTSKIKKLFTTLLAVILSLTVVACNNQNNTGDNGGDPNNKPKEEVVIPTYTEPTTIDYTGYNTFYFDGNGGNDANSGKSQLSPKKSLEEMTKIASTATADYPVRILLKRGSTFDGKLILTGYTALKEKPLIVSDYGTHESMPKLVGVNKDTDTLYSVIKLNFITEVPKAVISFFSNET